MIYTLFAKDQDREDVGERTIVDEKDLAAAVKELFGREGVTAIELFEDTIR